ncbi:DUF4397 domain-containing protein, partial [Pseudonocardia sp.]|uniref:DUF4397 domain-containing protein n=1 Tax=Pseudonocardia sp. TaxID=60912 RepID=UPI002631B23F
MDTAPRPTLRSRLMTAAVLLPLLVVVAVMRLVNLVGAPQRIDDEGTYMAQAYAMLHLGELTHYTYWYDHPPLGWLQIAGWLALAEKFGPVTDAVAAGRRFMVLAAVIAAALLWVLVRRLGYGRIAAGAAVALLALSPLAVQYERTVYLDNLSTVWVLAAAVCFCTPRRRLLAYMGGAVCFAVAVLTKETALLMLPVIAWLGWQRGNTGTRRYAMAVAGALFGLLISAYLLAAAVRSELLPGKGHVSLVDGIAFQLFSRTSGGSVATPGSPNQQTLLGWLSLDSVLLAAGLVAALVALAVKGLRPVAFGYLLLAAMLLRGGYLPIPYVIVVLPLAALLIAAVSEEAVRRIRAGVPVVKIAAAALLVAVAGAGVVAEPRWNDTLTFLTTADQDAPLREAKQWVLGNVSHDQRLIVDDAFWSDLVTAGWKRNDVGWFYKLDTDPAVQALNPHGWRDYDYVIATDAVRQFPASFAQVHGAMTGSQPVATFGSGASRVEIRRIDPNAAAPAAEPERATVGAALADRLGANGEKAALALLRSGDVDARVLATLSDVATTDEVLVADLPQVPGEDAAGRPRRQIRFTATGTRADRLVAYYKAQEGAFTPQSVTAGPAGVLVTFPPAAPSGLLTAAAKPPAAGRPAALRVLDLVPGSAPLRVRLAGVDGTAVAPIEVGPYGDVGRYQAVPAGVATLGVGPQDPAKPTAVTQAVALDPGAAYTLMLFAGPGGGAGATSIRGQLVPDPAVPGPDIRGIVRLVDAAQKAPGLTLAAAGAGPLAKNISYGLVTGYAELVPGTVPLTMTSGTVTTTGSVTLRNRDVMTLVVLDGVKGPQVVVVDDPVRAPAAAPLDVTPPARPGVLAPAKPGEQSGAAPAPVAKAGYPLGNAPLAVLGWGLLASAVGLVLRRRGGAAAALAAATPAPIPFADDETVLLERAKVKLGRAPRPVVTTPDPDGTALVEDIDALRAAAAAATAADGERTTVIPTPRRSGRPATPRPATPHPIVSPRVAVAPVRPAAARP